MTDNYGRSIQLGASRRRYEDAQVLQSAGRWNGAIYLAGYAIECSLKSLICYNDGRKNTLTETKLWDDPSQRGAALHNLESLIKATNAPSLVSLLGESNIKKKIALDRTGSLKRAWTTVKDSWKKDERRYGNKVGFQSECDRFMADVKVLYSYILEQQGEFL